MVIRFQSYNIYLTNTSYLLETQNSILSMFVGLCFILGDFFGNVKMYDRHPDIYVYMEWAPAWIWGTLYLSAGVLHLIALYSKWQWHRKHVILAKVCLWCFIGLCVLQAEFFAPSGWCYLVFSFSAIVAFQRMRLMKEGPTKNADALEHN